MVLKRALLILMLITLTLTGVLLWRTYALAPPELNVPAWTSVTIDVRGATERLAQAVRHQTLTHEETAQFDTAAFEAFHAFLEASFPRVHETLKREKVNGLSLLYTWPGADSQAEPMILLAHQDVVPVEPGTERDWTHPAFDGVADDEFVWGRGTLDDKGSILGMLEAVEALIADGFQPQRTVYLCFGHDEEVGGNEGARHIAQTLEERGVKAYLLVDEGLAITRGVVPGLDVDLALVGVAEKGYLTVNLEARAEGGHSSTPPPETAVGILAAAVARIQQEPFPAKLDGPMRQMLEAAGPHMNFPMRVVMANLWLFGPVVKTQLAGAPATNAGIRTTTAPTLLSAGTKANVLPQSAHAAINFRLMPGETIESAMARITATVADSRVSVSAAPNADDPSPVSLAEGPAWDALAMSIRQVFPEAAVAPGLVLGGTDCPHYEGVAAQIYRFMPFVFTGDDLNRVHGTDERLRIEDYLSGIRWYAQLLRNGAG
jgi:carboxypeptidase PM20D1